MFLSWKKATLMMHFMAPEAYLENMRPIWISFKGTKKNQFYYSSIFDRENILQQF